jgi:GWxTD domain-containing protein
MQVQWQAINRPYDALNQELVIYFTIDQHRIQYLVEDSLFYAEYETRLKVFDKDGNQVAGDFWEHIAVKDTADIQDSVKLIIPRSSQYFDMKIVDIHGGNVFSITENVLSVKYIGDIERFINGDTLRLAYTILNRAGDVDSLHVTINDMRMTKIVKQGTYGDTLIFMLTALPNDTYTALFELYSDGRKIEELKAPLFIARAFYLNDDTWRLKVHQLEYIATPSEIDLLESAYREERDSLWNTFWKQHDPTPNTKFNEMEEEYFKRIAYCEEHFSHGDKGWQSDRAKVYVRYGSPDEIQRKPYELYAEFPDPYGNRSHIYDSYEVWFYYRLNLQFVFADRFGLGEYILLNPQMLGL